MICKRVLTPAAGDIGVEPAAGLGAGGTPREVYGAAQVLEPPQGAVRVRRLQPVRRMQCWPAPVGVQHHVSALHALPVAAG